MMCPLVSSSVDLGVVFPRDLVVLLERRAHSRDKPARRGKDLREVHILQVRMRVTPVRAYEYHCNDYRRTSWIVAYNRRVLQDTPVGTRLGFSRFVYVWC